MPTILAEVVWVTSVTVDTSATIHTECLVSMDVSNDEGVTNPMVGRIEFGFNDVGDSYTIAGVHVRDVLDFLPFGSSWYLESLAFMEEVQL